MSGREAALRGNGGKIRVLIVDDSASVRQTLSDVLSGEGDIEVMQAASDPFVAAGRIQKETPDVIILDVEMPRMDGLTFLRKIMAQRPIPVVMCSSLTEQGSETLVQAVEAGAVDVIAKPRVDTRQFLIESRVRICDGRGARGWSCRVRGLVGRSGADVGDELQRQADQRIAAARRGEFDRSADAGFEGASEKHRARLDLRRLRL